jgi:hypothetical protein
MRRVMMMGSILGLLFGLGLAVSAQAEPGKGGETSAKEKCDGYYETRQREIPPGSGNIVPFTAYWVPMAYPDGVDDLPVLNRAGCITTVLAGGNVEPVPYAALSTTAINAQCKFLESTALAGGYPYRFYGNPNYEAKNRSDCIYFLRQFHLGNLPPGPG